jgi:NADH dehydrogenase/NADH:ubiquinone oxidoreductase subunit G
VALKVTINGKIYEAEKDEFVLEVCRRNHILVPTLCDHESLKGLGACRLCVVEVNEGGGNKVVVSCVYPLSRDCEVFTESEKIKGIRKTILSMLKTRAPEGERLSSLCQIYGVQPDTGRFTFAKAISSSSIEGSSSEKRLASSCVLCGLCVQACSSLGSGAISTVGRGVGKKISTPYDEPSADCVGCGSCAAVCPTRAIECIENGESRSIWGKEFTLLKCASCGRAFTTHDEYAFALKKSAQENENASDAVLCGTLCATCRKKKSADVLAAAFGERA